MDKQLLKLECLKLVKTHLGPEEMIAQAEKLHAYVTGEQLPSVQPDNSIPLPPKLNEPGDGVKEHK